MTSAPATEVALPRVPALGGLYGRGLVASARLGVTGGARSAGRTLPDVTYVVGDVRADADHLTAYQHLLQESATDDLPAGFVHVLAFPVAMALMVRPDFPLPLLGMVHVANRVEQHRAVTLGDRLAVRAWAQDLRPHRSGTQVDLVTEVAADGDVAWQGVSTYLAKGVRLAAGPRDDASDGSAGGVVDGVVDGSLDGSAGTSARKDFTPPVRTARWELPADVGRRYAAVSGDRNPIHLSPVTARALGFRRAIAHGMYTASRALADVGAARGDAFTWSAEFAAPVLLPATPDVRVAPDGDGHAFTVWHPRSGRLHLSGRVAPHAP